MKLLRRMGHDSFNAHLNTKSTDIYTSNYQSYLLVVECTQCQNKNTQAFDFRLQLVPLLLLDIIDLYFDSYRTIHL
jgi:hypothetical protein